MDATQLLEALERQRELLEHFIGLSREHLLLWEDEDLVEHDTFLRRRDFLMSELVTMAETVSIRIRQIYTDPLLAGATMDELRHLNNEIVEVATQIMDIDERLRQNLHGSTAVRRERPLD